MFSKIAILATLSFALSVAAAPRGDSCNTGTVSCCNSWETQQGVSAISQNGNLVGAVIQNLAVVVGHNCSPLAAVLASGGKCSSQPLCCSNNHYEGLVVVGCSPINVL